MLQNSNFLGVRPFGREVDGAIMSGRVFIGKLLDVDHPSIWRRRSHLREFSAVILNKILVCFSLSLCTFSRLSAVNLKILHLAGFQISDFFNWNRVKLRYCDGASFTGDSQDKVDGLSSYFQCPNYYLPLHVGFCVGMILSQENRVKALHRSFDTRYLIKYCSAAKSYQFDHFIQMKSCRHPTVISLKEFEISGFVS